MKLNLIGLLFGVAFGGVLAASNLHEYDTIHAMLRLDEFDVFWFMASAIAVSAPLLWLLERRRVRTPFGGELAFSRSKLEGRIAKAAYGRIDMTSVEQHSTGQDQDQVREREMSFLGNGKAVRMADHSRQRLEIPLRRKPHLHARSPRSRSFRIRGDRRS